MHIRTKRGENGKQGKETKGMRENEKKFDLDSGVRSGENAWKS